MTLQNGRKLLINAPKKIALAIIFVYQKTLSLDHGPLARPNHPRCKFYPTCSVYAHEAIKKFGLLRGSWMAIKRIGRCHPWSKGGLDLTPDKK